MRIQMQHPAIVSRRKREQSEPAYAMVKVTSPIEVADYSSSDVQTAAILHHGRSSTTYRRIGDHLYKQMDHMPAGALESGTDMARTLIGKGSTFDFGAFMNIVHDSALQLADAEPFDNVAYAHKPLSIAETRTRATTAMLKAFDKAPERSNQTWITRAADGEIAEWAEKFQDFMRNVALVDGTVHVRSFEPCYIMNLRPPETRVISIDKMRVMEKVIGRRPEFIRGVPQLGTDWGHVENRLFSLNERDRAVELAEQFGFAREWIPDSNTRGVTVVDASALSSDFLKEETLRLAVAALDIADTVANDLAGLSYSNVTGREVLAARLAEISTPETGLRDIVNSSADHDEGVLDTSTKALSATFIRDGEIMNPATRRRVGALHNAIEFLDARRDAMPISVMTAANSPCPH